jgi:hypothetical protein
LRKDRGGESQERRVVKIRSDARESEHANALREFDETQG